MTEYFTVYSLTQILFFMLALTALAWPLGLYMARVYNGEAVFLSGILSPVERFLYKIAGVDSAADMTWQQYALAVLASAAFGFALLFGILLFQDMLPLNPQGMAGLDPDLAFGTAVSFATNTNWQAYGGETTMSYFSQMAGLAVQNFLSAAMGMAVLAALVRGLNGHGIPDSIQKRIFDKFYSFGDQVARGTGLGLTICRAVVELHGGAIWADHNAMGGATILFTLPRTRSEEDSLHGAAA